MSQFRLPRDPLVGVSRSRSSDPISPALGSQASKEGPTVGLAPSSPRVNNRASVPGRTASTVAGYVQGILRKFAAPIAGVMLGAATLPAMAGGALDATSEVLTPPATEQVVSVKTSHAGAVAVSEGSLHAESLYQAYVQQRAATLAAQLRAYQAQAPADPVVYTDLIKLHEVVARFDRLMQTQGQLPAELLIDLDHVLEALSDARPGELQLRMHEALRTLPSVALRTPTLPSQGIEAPSSPRVGRLPAEGLNALFSASPTDFSDQAQAVVQQYSAITAGISAATSRLPDFELPLRNPLVYDTGDGLLLIPPGAKLVHQGDRFAIEAAGLLWQQDDLTVVSKDASLEFGDNLDGLRATQVTAQGSDWAADLRGATLGLNRAEGSAIIQADQLDINLVDKQAHLTGAQLYIGPSGRSTLGAERVQVTEQGFTLDLSGLQAEQTRAGTQLSAQQGVYAAPGTLIRGEAIEMSFGPDGARLQSDALDIQSGSTEFRATQAVLTATPLRARGQVLKLDAEALSFGQGTSQVQVADGVSLQMRLDKDGQLRGARASGGQLLVATREGQANLTGSALDVQLDAQGRFTRMTARSDAASFTGADFGLQATGGKLDLTFDPTGHLRTAQSEADVVAYQGAGGALDVQGGKLGLRFEDGLMRQATAQAASTTWQGKDGTRVFTEGSRLELGFHAGTGSLASAKVATGTATFADATHSLDMTGVSLAAAFDPQGNLTGATGRGAKLTYVGAEGTFFGAGNLALDVQTAGEAVSRVGLSANELKYQGAMGDIQAAQGSLVVDFDQGRAQHLRFDTRDLTATGDYGELRLTGAGSLDAAWSPDGESLKRLSAEFDGGQYHSDFGQLTLDGGNSFSIEYEDSGAARLSGHATQLDLAQDAGRLQLTGGRVQGHLTAAGVADELRIGADHLVYSGTAEGDHPLSVDLAGPDLTLTSRPEGGQRLSFNSEGGHFEVEGHKVGLQGAQQILLETTPDGQVDAFSADFPGQVDFVDRDGDLSVLTRDAHAQYDRQGSRVHLDFGAVEVALRGEGLQAQIQGLSADLDDSRFRVQVDQAHVLKALGEQLEVDVQALTLEVRRNGQGALQAFDLSLGGMEAQIDAISAMVRTPDGERVRLHISADEEGRTIKQAYLQIPEGGEIRISRDDFDLRLGGQRLSFDHGDDGVYRLRADGMDIEAQTKDAQVSVQGGTAQVSLDPNSGRLVIDEITGTRVDVRTPGNDQLHLDIEQLQGFMVRMTGFEGGATGAAVHLVPTEDGSRLTASLVGEVGGIPVEVRVNDAHELTALGQLSENQVHVFVGDPSGQGDLQIGVGPVKIQGSALEVVGRYHAYDPGRMTERVHQFATTSGAQLFSGVSFEPDGVLRIGTDRDGLNGELAVLLPRQFSLPGYQLDMSSNPSSAIGLVGSLGFRTSDLTFSGFAGLLPGSHATLHVAQGDIEVGGVNVPKRTDLPSTVIAGLRLDLADVGGGQFGVVGGAYANPAGFVDSPWLKEQQPFGGFGGVEYRRDSWSISGSAVLDVDRDGGVRLGGAQLRLGISF